MTQSRVKLSNYKIFVLIDRESKNYKKKKTLKNFQFKLSIFCGIRTFSSDCAKTQKHIKHIIR